MKNLITFEQFKKEHFTPEELAIIEKEVDIKLALRDLKDLLRRNQLSLKSVSNNMEISKYENIHKNTKRIRDVVHI